MNKGFGLKLFVEYRSVFDEEPQELREYLTGISRTTLLNVAAFFLGFANQKSEFSSYQRLISVFFRRENEQIAQEILQKLNILDQEYPGGLVIISPLSALQLFEFSFEELTEEETQTPAQVEVSIFKACLLLNQLNTDKQKTASDTTHDLPEPIRLAGLSLAQSYAYSEFTNYDQTEVFIAQIVKSVYLFEFMESMPTTTLILNRFLQYYDCASWKEYLRKLLPIIIPVLKAEKEAHTDIHIERTETFEASCNFIEKLVIQESEELDEYDFRSVRINPIYKVSDGVYRIIFGLFVIEKIHKALYFKFNEINKELNKTLPKNERIKDFRGTYCDDFSERYLLYKTLQSTYEGRYVEFTGSQIKNEYGITGEPDYYIRKSNCMFLHESKDILINAEVKQSFNFNQYEKEFKKKLYFEEENGSISNKAVLQLINNIKRALLKQFTFDTNYKERSIYIYPIIVLHDHQFNLAGLNVLVNHWFQEELNKLKAEGLYTDRVQPVVIITIDDLIYYQDLLKSRSVKLEEVLDAYFKYITLDKKKKYKDQAHFKEHCERTVVPFSLFIHNYIQEKKLQRSPKMIMAKTISLFK